MLPPLPTLVGVVLVVAILLGSQFAFDGASSPNVELPERLPELPITDTHRPTFGPSATSASTTEPSATSPPVTNLTESAVPADSTPVSSCRELDAPGRYHLTADIVSRSYTCLKITADDVVLDGRGHTLTVAESARKFGEALMMPTPDYFGEAVLVADGQSNVTVADLSFQGFDVGVRSAGGADHAVLDVRGTDTVTAVHLDGVDGALLRSVTVARSAEDGLVVANASNVVLRDVHVETSYFAGIVVSGSQGVSIDATTVSRNHGDGLLVFDSSAVVATGLRASENAVGALVIDADGTTLRSSTFDRNRIAGVAVGRAVAVTVADSTISHTLGDPGVVAIDRTAGLLALEAADVTLRDVTVVGNQDWTVAATDSSTVRVERVTAGSTVVSLAVADVAVDLDSLADRPCTDATATTIRSELTTEPAGGAGTLDGVRVTCTR